MSSPCTADPPPPDRRLNLAHLQELQGCDIAFPTSPRPQLPPLPWRRWPVEVRRANTRHVVSRWSARRTDKCLPWFQSYCLRVCCWTRLASASSIKKGRSTRVLSPQLKNLNAPEVPPGYLRRCLLAGAAQHACSTRLPVVRHDALFDANGTLHIDTSVDVPRFDPGDEALAFLREQGYVVIRGVANSSELAHARELLWDFLEGAGVGVERGRPETWINSAPNQYGIVWEFGVGQSRLMWFLRCACACARV